MGSPKKQPHNQVIQRYRDKRKQQLKRVEIWIENPEKLALLKQYSRLNQTEVMNALVNIVADGVNQEDESQDIEEALDQMVNRILEVFEKII